MNRNTAATYFGTGAVVWLLITLEIIQGRLPQGALNWLNFGSAILDGRSPKLIAALSCIALRGNHDEVLLAFLADPRTGDLWRRMGGVETHCTPTEVNVADFRQGKDLD